MKWEYFEAIAEAEWRPLQKQLKNSISFRNYLAHFEISYVRDLKYVPPGDPPVVLVPHHMEDKVRGQPMVKAVNLTELNQWGENYRALARDLVSLVKRHFSLEKLRATHLPQEWLRFLGSEEI